MEEATLYEGNPAKFVRKLSYDEKVRGVSTRDHLVLVLVTRIVAEVSEETPRACTCMSVRLACRTPPMPMKFCLTPMSHTDDTCVFVCRLVFVFSSCARSIGITSASLLRPDCARETRSVIDRDRARLGGSVHSD